MKNLIISCNVFAFMLFCSCVFSSDNTDHAYARYSKELPFAVTQITDEGFYGDSYMYLQPFQFSTDGFYLVESPDMFTQVFEQSSPEAGFFQTLFPEGGMLLIHISETEIGYLPYEHMILLEGNTVIIDEHTFIHDSTQVGASQECFSIVGVIPAP